MGDKPEVFLEVGAGFLRIPTTEINYNITVIDTGGSRSAVTPPAAAVVPPVPHPPSTLQSSGGGQCDDFYEVISNDLYQDIGELAKSLSSTIVDIPAEDRKLERATLDEAGDKIEGAKAQLRDIVEMTERAAMEIMDSVESVQDESMSVKTLLEELKGHAAFNNEASDADESDTPEESPLAQEVASLTTDIDEVQALVDAIGGSVGEEDAAPIIEKSSRYLFDLDVIFQTLYELCTNETVKDHITAAREKAAELFDIDAFQDKISEKAVHYEADGDNYFDVPMSDVFQSLFGVCSDNGIKNLLKKMDSGQSSIFLDQAIPLEVPEIKEIETEVVAEVTAKDDGPAEDLEPIAEILTKIKEGLGRVSEMIPDKAPTGGVAAMTVADQKYIFAKIEAAFDVSANISCDVSKITEALSFQDLSGQQILKIIKLLSDFQVQLLAIVVSFGSQLKHKTENVGLSVAESKQLAQDDVDKYISGVPEETDGGMLDQDTVNNMLADFGFD